MKIIEKIMQKQKNLRDNSSVTLAFLGDSVTQGCFEVYMLEDNRIQTVFDVNSSYHRYLLQLLAMLYPSVPVNVINAGISGTTAENGLSRLDRDVLRHDPDLVVVCFGLNDSAGGTGNLCRYVESLEQIFKRLKERSIEVIFMTPNMMCTEVSCAISDPRLRKIAQQLKEVQNSGILKRYLDAAKALCEKCGVPVCDCYGKWERMEACGVNTTKLLSNHINHPTRQMNWLFAVSLLEQMMN